MRQDTEQKIRELFYEHPGRKFTIREISKLTGVPRATAHKQLLKLKGSKLIGKNNMSDDNLLFKIKKINYFTEKLVYSGLIEELVEKLNPSCIILFGSIRKGDSAKESDIDLFVESSVKKNVELNKFERKLGHKVQLLVESDIKKLPKNLLSNVVNGIKIYGSFKI